MKLNNLKLTDIIITKHALERAKQRIQIGVDQNTFEYEVKLKELIKMSEFNIELEKNEYKYILIFQMKVYEIIVLFKFNKCYVKTIIGKK